MTDITVLDFEADSVIIPLTRYYSLCNSEEKLFWLHASGVDNWEGYEEAMKNCTIVEEEDEENDE